MNAPLRYLSVCSGIEVAALAWVPLGWQPVLVSEIEAFPREVLRIRHGAFDARFTRPADSLVLWSDFTALRMRHLRRLGIDPADIDVLVGGTPCQGFSVAGLRGSLSDPRGGLSLAFIRLAHAIQSARARAGKPGLIVVWENVPGVLSTPDNAFGCFMGALVGADDAVLPGACPPRGRSNKLWRWRPAGRWPVLDDEGNETDRFIERAEGHIPSWPSAGMVAGPRARAAWRVFDAQHFGLAQRRERVFLVGSLGEGRDPAEILFEPEGLRGNPASGRKAAEDVAPTLAGGARSSGGYSTDDIPLTAGTIIANGDRTRGAGMNPETLVAHPLRARHNASHRADSDTYVPALATTLRARDGAKGVDSDATDTLIPVAYGGGVQSGPRALAAALTAHPSRSDFDTETFVVAEPIAFSCKDHGADAGHLAPTLRAMNFDGSHANGGGQVAIAFNARQDPDVSGSVTGPLDMDGGTQAILTSGVRRLLPVECERLQGVPDHFTRIPWRGQPEELCPDGPRYRALGNAYPRPVLAWIGRRIAAVDAAPSTGAAA